jgi:hypothetical protein
VYKNKSAPSEIVNSKIDQGKTIKIYGIGKLMKLKSIILMNENPSSYVLGLDSLVEFKI